MNAPIPEDLRAKVEAKIALVSGWYEGHSQQQIIEECCAQWALAEERNGNA